MPDGSEQDSDLASLFVSITGRSTVTEPQEEAVDVRTMDETGGDGDIVSVVNDGLDDAIGNGGGDPSGFDE